jgi:arylsulfatase A
MLRRILISLALLATAFLGANANANDQIASGQNATAATTSRPNIVVIICDDLGYGDLGVHGHPIIRTDNIDRLAKTGIRFSNFYSAAPVCSPSRVGLMTGRSPNRAGVFDWIPESKGPKTDARDLVHMRRSEITLPQLLQKAGYATCMAGKWHCNSQFNSPDQPQPNDAGFDHWLATQNNAGPSHEDPRNYVRNGKPVGELKGFSCQIVVDEATQWLEQKQSTAPDQPFFLYLAFHEPHEPVASPQELVQQYLPQSMNEDQAQYFANVHNMDLAVGRLVATLDKLKLRDNTLIVFSSDNGPETLRRYKAGARSWGRTGILRGMKLHTHDGGFHVAGIMNWPARISPGHVVNAPASSLDLLPTLCDLAGADVPQDRSLDGISLAPLVMEGKMPDRTQPLLWAYYNAINEQRVAMRHGPWKVLARLNGGTLPRMENLTPESLERVQSATLTDFAIYDLSKDPGETQNLAGQNLPDEPELISLMQSQYRSLAADSHGWPRE